MFFETLKGIIIFFKAEGIYIFLFFVFRKIKSQSDTVLYPAQLIEMGKNNKRNFDEIDHNSGFSGFNSKRNFDEIDRSSGFSGFNAKRNFDEIDRTDFSSFNKKRNFDEIDRSSDFSGFSRKRDYESNHRIVPYGYLVSKSLSSIAHRQH